MNREEIEKKLEKLREAKKAEVFIILSERQSGNDKAAAITDIPAPIAALTFSEIEIIENRYNAQIAALKEQIRLADIMDVEEWLLNDSGDEEIELEKKIETIKNNLSEFENKLNAIIRKKGNAEKRIKQRASDRIRYKCRARDLNNPQIPFREHKELIANIIAY